MNKQYRIFVWGIIVLFTLHARAHERISYAQLHERMKQVQRVCDTFGTKPDIQPVVSTHHAAEDPFDDFFATVDTPAAPSTAQSGDPFADFFDAPGVQPAGTQQSAAATLEDPFDDFFGDAPVRTTSLAPVHTDGVYITYKLTEPATAETRSALLALACAFEDNFSHNPVPVGSLVHPHPTEPDCYYVGPLTHPDAERLLALEQGLQSIAPNGKKPSIYFWVTAAKQPTVPAVIGARRLGKQQKHALGENPAAHVLYYTTRTYCWRTNMTYACGSIMRYPTIDLIYMPGVLRTYIKRLFA